MTSRTRSGSAIHDARHYNEEDATSSAELIKRLDRGKFAGALDLLESDGFPEGAINIPNREGRTALLWACLRSAWDIATKLLEKGADPNIVDLHGDSPLRRAVMNANEAAIVALIEKGADPNVFHRNGTTPLMEAAKLRLASVIQTLFEISQDIDPNLTSTTNEALPIHYAIATGHVPTIKAILSHPNCDVMSPDAQGNNPHSNLAPRNANREEIQKLIDDRYERQFASLPRKERRNIGGKSVAFDLDSVSKVADNRLKIFSKQRKFLIGISILYVALVLFRTLYFVDTDFDDQILLARDNTILWGIFAFFGLLYHLLAGKFIQTKDELRKSRIYLGLSVITTGVVFGGAIEIFDQTSQFAKGGDIRGAEITGQYSTLSGFIIPIAIIYLLLQIAYTFNIWKLVELWGAKNDDGFAAIDLPEGSSTGAGVFSPVVLDDEAPQ